ncbi:hypothetical protein LINPERHAP2_LOCUS25389 [Linum perenne]
MKRKEFPEIEDDFSSPSLYSPSTKSRKLDSELLRSLEEGHRVNVEDATMGEESEPHHNVVGGVFRWDTFPTGAKMPVDDNPDEKAIVLYQPLPRSLSSPQHTIVLDYNLVPWLKDYIYWPGSSTEAKSVYSKLAADKSIRGSNDNLAVVPWVAPQPPNFSVSSGQVRDSSGPVEAEECEMMDMDESDCNHNSLTDKEVGGMAMEKELQQWQQQHCIIPQVIENISTPVYW